MERKVLFVDDEVNILNSIRRNLRKEFSIETATSGKEGLDILQTKGDFAVVVSDMKMPEMDGTKFLSLVKEKNPDSVRLLLTGQADIKDAISVVNEGQIFKFLTKPCPTEILTKAVKDSLRQYELIRSEKELLNNTLKGIIKLLIDILSVLNPEAFSKSSRVHGWVNKIARRINYKDMWQLDVAVMLSQIGCVTLSTDLLTRKYRGEKLSIEEKNEFFKHINVGSELIKKIPRLEHVSKIIEYQEKYYNGGGIPENNLTGKSIPLASRILKIIIDFDDFLGAGLTSTEALIELKKNSTWYDPKVVSALEAELSKTKEEYVVVEIKSSEIESGMVLADDIKTKYGVLLIPKGYEISDVLRLRILNFSRNNNIKEPIKLLSTKS